MNQPLTPVVNDPVHMDPDGSWWFYDETGAGRYGPYPDDATARRMLSDYIAWLNQQVAHEATQQAQQQAVAQAAPSEMDMVVAEYLRLRDLKAEITERHKGELREITEQMDTSENFLLAELQRLGLDSFKVAHGTVYTTSRLFASIGDKDAFMTHIKNTGEIELLQSRVSSDVLKTWMANHGGNCPPGVKAAYERVIGIRRT
jgi:hypothetical protein